MNIVCLQRTSLDSIALYQTFNRIFNQPTNQPTNTSFGFFLLLVAAVYISRIVSLYIDRFVVFD